MPEALLDELHKMNPVDRFPLPAQLPGRCLVEFPGFEKAVHGSLRGVVPLPIPLAVLALGLGNEHDAWTHLVVVFADVLQQQLEGPAQPRLPQSRVADERPQDGAVLLLDVGVVVLPARPRAAEARPGPVPRQVLVDDRVDQLGAAVGVHAPDRERHRLEVSLERRLVVRRAQVEARARLEPPGPAVCGRRLQKKSPSAIPTQKATLST